MGIRRQAREIAVQVLYLIDFRDEVSPDADLFSLPEVEPLFKSLSVAVKSYSSILVKGVLSNREAVDRFLSLSSDNWSLHRMARVDKAILRIGAFEMLAVSNVPPSVVIDEALEIAKIFSSDEAPMYINGVLDRVSVVLAGEGLVQKDSLNVDSEAIENFDYPLIASKK